MSIRTLNQLVRELSVWAFITILLAPGIINPCPVMGQGSITVGPNKNVSRRSANQSETAVSINPANPNNIVIISNHDNSASLMKSVTFDGGNTWVENDIATGSDGLPAACCDGSTNANFDQFGNMFVAYLTSSINLVVAVSSDGGNTFQLVAQLDNFVDQPTLVVGPSGTPGVEAVWVCFNSGGQMAARGAKVTGAGPAGVGPFSPTQFAPSATGSFGDIAIGPNGQLMIVYQDPTGGEGPSTIAINVDPDGLGPAGFGPRLNLGTTNVGGFDFIPAQSGRSVDAETGLVYDRTGGPHNGRVYLVYADEFPAESNDHDIFLRYSDNDGASWTAPKRVNDDNTTRSQFLPKIAIDPTTGFIAIGFHDCRLDAGVINQNSTNSIPNDDAQYWITASIDGGQTFLPCVQISAGTSNAADANNGIDFGDYTGLAFFGGRAYPAWADNSNSTGDNPDGTLRGFDVYTSRIDISGVPPPISLSINPNRVSAGNSTTGTITLRDPAPANGAIVLLTVSDPNSAFIPGSVIVPGNSRTTTFNIDTSSTVNGTTTVDITATYGPDSATAQLTIVPFIAGVELQSQFFPFPWLQTHAEVGGPVVYGRVVLSDPAPEPAGVVVALTSLIPGTASVTPSVTVQAGQRIAYFPVFTTPVSADTDVLIFGSSNGSVAFAVDTVLAPTPSSVLISPNVVPGGTGSTGTVYLNGVAPSHGLPVQLTSNQVPFVTVNPVVFIQPGKTYGSFPITTTQVPNDITAKLTASYNGVSASGALKVTAAGLSSFVISPSSVSGGAPSMGFLTLLKPAPAAGSDVDLTYNPPGQAYPATFPASVHINGGQTQAAFTITTTPTGLTMQVPIKATLRGTPSNKTATLTVMASGVSSITITPTVMHAGTTTLSGYVFLSGPAPAVGANVTLAVFGGGSTNPVIVKIPAGQSRGQFSFTAPTPVPAAGITVTVSATYPAGVTKFCQVRVIP